MDTSSTSPSAATNVRWRSVGLPTEHGGWSFIAEPILLGLLLAPSGGALALGVAALGLFLLRQPLKIVTRDRRSGREYARTRLALRFVLLYGGLTLVAVLGVLLLLPAPAALIPLLLALPLVALQIRYDVENQSRAAIAEMAGALATGALTAAMLMMNGWTLLTALGVWAFLALKAAGAVLYVRARLRLEKGKPAAVRLAVGIHAAGALLLALAAAAQIIPFTAPLALVILTARAAWGLSARRKSVPAKIVGMQEVGYGLLSIALIAIGYSLR